MQLNDISCQQFSKFASRGPPDRMTLTDRGLVLGAGTLLAKLDGKALPIEADQERIWTLLSVAYWSRGRPWIESGWEDGHAGYWKTK